MIDLEGQRFGRLTAIEYQGERRWLCVCDCGNAKFIEGYSLRNGLTQSCGCLHKEVTGTKHRTHGHSHSPAYTSWSGMRERCLNPRYKHYKNWGGRGITISERWSSFANFLADMGERQPGMTLERIDNDGNYEPGNCCWVPKGQQSKNRRPFDPWANRRH